jgi:DNA-binding transcriptional ArsR family regulator
MDAFYALAEPRRRRIIEILANRGQMSATEISKKFGHYCTSNIPTSKDTS